MGRKSKTFTIRLSKELCRSAKESACGLDVNSDRTCPNITDVIEAYKEDIVDDMWENQQKILSLSRSLVVNSDRKCPNITDVIEEYKEGIVDDIFETRLKISELSDRMQVVFNVDAESNVLSIPAIEDAASVKRIWRLLARENNVEFLFHKQYAELVSLVGHLEVVPDLITNEFAKTFTQVDKTIRGIRRDIRNILHKLQQFGRRLGVPDIRKKLCRYKRKVILKNETDRINYALRIVAIAENKTTHIQSLFDKISAATENCQLVACSRTRNVLSCEHGGSKRFKGCKRPKVEGDEKKSEKGKDKKGGKRKGEKQRNHSKKRHQRKC